MINKQTRWGGRCEGEFSLCNINEVRVMKDLRRPKYDFFKKELSFWKPRGFSFEYFVSESEISMKLCIKNALISIFSNFR